MSVWAIVVAAGSGTRMGGAGNKVLLPLAGMPVLAHSVYAFVDEVDGIIIVTRAVDVEAVTSLALPATVIIGGGTRQESVYRGLCALPDDADIVLVHDAARPFVGRDVIRRCIEGAREKGNAVAAVPVKDTIKEVDSEVDVVRTPERDMLMAAQTPQAFKTGQLRQAIETLQAQGKTASDDAGAIEATGGKVHLVLGDYRNNKLTTPEDMVMAKYLMGDMPVPRIGQGYDVHKLVADRALVLCGIQVPYEKGLLGHSDADVATHALMDALLGAAALEDIGRHFPDSDPQYKGISSITLLQHVIALLAENGYMPGNVDVTIVAQSPKLATYIPQMRELLASTMKIPIAQVNVKATTTEGLGFVGDGLGIAAHAVALLTPVHA